jgi:hypothetical protein
METKTAFTYDDNYLTCDETHASLRIYYQDQQPNFITEYLGITPTNIQIKGQLQEYKGNKLKKEYPLNGWFLSSKEIIDSKDARRHIDYILDKLIPSTDKIHNLTQIGARIELVCFWRTAQGHGGPIISPEQSSKLSKLFIPLWFDFYS